MPKHNLDTVREIYEKVLARGRQEDPATAGVIPQLFDPEIHISQMSSLAGTAGDFQGYAGVVESAVENVRVIAELEFVPDRMRSGGDRVAVEAVARGVGRRSGVPIEARVVHLFTLREGRVLRLEVFENPADAFLALAPEGKAADRPDWSHGSQGENDRR